MNDPVVPDHAAANIVASAWFSHEGGIGNLARAYLERDVQLATAQRERDEARRLYAREARQLMVLSEAQERTIADLKAQLTATTETP